MGRRLETAARRVGLALGIAVAALVGIGFGLGRTIGGVPDAPAATCDEPVPWDRAAQVVGERAAIAGTVVAGSHEPDVGGEPTFLNLGNPHPDPDRFDVVLYPDVRERYDTPPEQALLDTDVCVQGEVRDRDGIPQIVVDSRAMLQPR